MRFIVTFLFLSAAILMTVGIVWIRSELQLHSGAGPVQCYYRGARWRVVGFPGKLVLDDAPRVLTDVERQLKELDDWKAKQESLRSQLAIAFEAWKNGGRPDNGPLKEAWRKASSDYGAHFPSSGPSFSFRRASRYSISLALPFAVAAISTTAFFILFLRLRTQRKRLQGNLCRTCGYDMRATLERCPECGCVSDSGAVESA